jgi:hypothetical protein
MGSGLKHRKAKSLLPTGKKKGVRDRIQPAKLSGTHWEKFIHKMDASLQPEMAKEVPEFCGIRRLERAVRVGGASHEIGGAELKVLKRGCQSDSALYLFAPRQARGLEEHDIRIPASRILRETGDHGTDPQRGIQINPIRNNAAPDSEVSGNLLRSAV